MSKGKIVTFRLASEHYSLLESKASGVSPNIYARELTLRGLHSEGGDEGVHSRLDKQQAEICRLNRNLFGLFCASLISFAKIEPEKARSWTKRIFR